MNNCSSTHSTDGIRPSFFDNEEGDTLDSTPRLAILSPEECSQEEHNISSLTHNGGSIFQELKQFLGLSETFVATVAAYAILGTLVGVMGGPIGICTGALIGVIVGGVLAHIASQEAGKKIGIDEASIGKVADFAILGSIIGIFGGPIGLIAGTVAGAMVGKLLAHLQEQNQEVANADPLIVTETPNQDEVDTLQPQEKRTKSTLQATASWIFNETTIGNIAWEAILGADAGAQFGIVGVAIGVCTGTVTAMTHSIDKTSTSTLKQEPKPPECVDQQPSVPSPSKAKEGGSMIHRVAQWLHVEESTVANVSGYAILGLMLGSIGGPIGATVGLVAGGTMGGILSYMEIPSPEEIEQDSVENNENNLETTKGGSSLSFLQTIGKLLNLEGIVETVVEYAILGSLIGVAFGPIGIVGGAVTGALIGYVLGQLEVHEQHDSHHDTNIHKK